MRVTIMYRNSYKGGNGWTYYPIDNNCKQCGEKRGKPELRNFCEDGYWHNLSVWENPCGHIDYYKDCYLESKKNGIS